MCDYSLMEVENRLAKEGDDLVVHRFQRGSIGLTECERPPEASGWRKDTVRRALAALRTFLQGAEPNSAVAVCIPPGARLLVADMPEDLQQRYNIGAVEEVTFTQLSAEANRHRDAIRLKNGAEILLQRLREGQRVRVLQLTLPEHTQPERTPTFAAVATER